MVSQQFNKQNPELEAETSELRVTVLHESIARSGRSISIRKTPPVIRLTAEKALQEQYCSRDILAVLVNCVLTKMNLIFCGMPGIGKTECVKFFSQYVSGNERVITMDHALGGAFQGGEIPFGRVVNGSTGNDHPAYGRCPEYPGPDFKYA